jgi:hypothetical protein
MATINWTRPKLEKFKKARASAVARGSESFLFEGQEVLCSYARYLIEYLESVLEPDRGQMNGFSAAGRPIPEVIRQRILHLWTNDPELPASTIAKRCGVDPGTVRNVTAGIPREPQRRLGGFGGFLR